jgi:hypothetical protein
MQTLERCKKSREAVFILFPLEFEHPLPYNVLVLYVKKPWPGMYGEPATP